MKAYQAMYQWYTKVLKVNLTTDYYEIIRSEDIEMESIRKNDSSMTSWFSYCVMSGIVHEDDRELFLLNTSLGYLRSCFQNRRDSVFFRFRRLTGGSYKWVGMEMARAEDYTEQNQTIYLLERDIDKEFHDQSEQMRELERVSHVDTLTNLNSLYAFQRMCVMHEQSMLHQSAGVAYADLNSLKVINDLQGHEVGNQYICSFAEKIRECGLQSNAYRVGGDEFILFFLGIQEREMHDKLKELLQWNENAAIPVASIGLAWTRSVTDINDLIKSAESDMYHVKELFYQEYPEYRRESQSKQANEETLLLLNNLAEDMTTLGIVNLEQETFRLLKVDPSLEYKVTTNSYREYLRVFMDELILPSSKEKMESIVSIEQFRVNLKNGESISLNFQIKNGSWRQITFRGVQEKNGLLTKMIFYAVGLNQFMSENLNSQQSFEEEAEILEGICEHYTLMCLLDTKSRMVHVIKSTELPQEIVTMINSASYQDSMSWLAKQYVYPNDIGRLRQVSSLETVLERLEKSDTYCYTFDTKKDVHKDGQSYSYKVTYSRPNLFGKNLVVVVEKLLKQSDETLEENKLRTEAFRALSENFESIVYVDLVEHKMYPFRINYHLPTSFWEFVASSTSYENVMEKYIKDRVIAADRSWVREQASLDNLRERLVQKAALTCDYRVVRDGKKQWYRMKFANLEDGQELRRFVVGYANVTDERDVAQAYEKTGQRILVVEDNALDREMLVDIIGEEYQVYTAADGLEALETLEELDARDEAVSLVITDLEMPNCDGYELMQRLKENPKYSQVFVIVMTANNTEECQIKCMALGATEFIAKPYNRQIILNRLDGLLRWHESACLINSLEKDSLTELFTRDFFYRYAESIVERNKQTRYFIHVTDIQNFKIINKKYGEDLGDVLLKNIAEFGIRQLEGYVLGGRLDDDRFVALRIDQNTPVERDEELLHKVLDNYSFSNVSIKSGYYRENDDISVREMCDRALIALGRIKESYSVNSAVYDDTLRLQLEQEEIILEDMDEALKTHQFQVYYQPKHDPRTGMIGGAEALVRWTHPRLGYLSPNKFIPLFERNGFITSLDCYVLDEACRFIRDRNSKGKPVFPISVNLSRRDLERDNEVENIVSIVDRYRISHNLIHLEITESAYSDNAQKIAQAVSRLHDLGFVIELDDFGVGYSTLTILNELELDVMKLDISIIRNDIPGSEKNILDFSMDLARMVGLSTVAEGVETEAQIERLKDLDCDYVQGFYFAKPMPREDFEVYLDQKAIKRL